MAESETSAEIDAAALDWAARVDEVALDAVMQSQLDEWLSGDRRRLGAYSRARAMFANIGRVKAFGPDFDPDAFLEQHRINTLSLGDITEDLVETDLPDRRRRLLVISSSAAIVAAAATTLGLSWQAAAQTYVTKKGEIRLVPLADGSSMTLNTTSEARVKFTDKKRYVELVEGEAMFDIASDPARPFVVEAGSTAVRAIGTSFAIRRLAQDPVEITVQQGVVEIDQLNVPSARSHRLTANMRAISFASPSEIMTSTIDPSEMLMALAWREGMLSFEDLSLRDAVVQFARYNDTRISFSDPAIGNETITGRFAANDPAGFARSAALGLSLKVDVKPGTIVFRR
jgi:transmembrane sensor